MDFRTVGSLLLLLLLGVCTAHQHEDLRNDNDELSLDDLEENDMTSTILRMNKDSKTFLLEGDIEITTDRNSIKCKSNTCLWPKSGSQVIIPYTTSLKYNEDRKKAIKDAMAEIERKTCVKFVPRKGQRAYLAIEPKNGCSSLVGHANHRQTVSLRAPGCLKHGIILHELLHALGFYHEHTRFDRDKYVRINWENMHRFYVYNFKKKESNYLNTPYDYSSVMHYGRTAFGENRKETIVPLVDGVEIGQRDHLSHIDVLRINRLYKC